MTEKEAVEVLKTHNDKCSGCDKLCNDLCKPAVALAIKALTEIQQYRVIEKRLDDMWEAYKSIGTLEECREAVEKQKAKACDVSGDGYADGHLVYDTYECPNCGKEYEIEYEEYEYCPNCGQHMVTGGWW